MDLLKQIDEAEAKADQLRQDAVVEAREKVKAAEENGVAKERMEMKRIRQEAQMLVEGARVQAEAEILMLQNRRASEREAMKSLAATRVEKASNMIFERVVRNGDR